MPNAIPICLLGFSDFERRTLAMQFGLAGARTPAYTLVAAPQQARLLVVDADSAAAVQRAVEAGRLADALLIGGGTAPAGALARLKRPIDALSLLRELDAAVWRTQNESAPAAEAQAAAATQAAAALAPMTARHTPKAALAEAPTVAAAVTAEALSAGRGVTDGAASTAASPPAPRAAEPADTAAQDAHCDALLVDDSEIALRFLQTKLGELGLRSRTATDSDSALKQLSEHDFRFVFLDVELGQTSRLDGLALCRHIKHMPRSGRPPVVAMVSAHASQTDRVRGTLAGCDAYLGKPLASHELMAVVSLRRAR